MYDGTLDLRKRQGLEPRHLWQQLLHHSNKQKKPIQVHSLHSFLQIFESGQNVTTGQGS